MNNKLDQFYTNPIVCLELVKIIKKLFEFSFKEFCFIEPSAGCGNFLDALDKLKIKDKNIKAYDIEPKEDKRIIQRDYLKTKLEFSKNNLVVGNPPFGRRGNKALAFLNKALNEANIVCFILPNIFKRYSIQSKVNQNAKLIFSINLPEDSFLVNDKAYNVGCVFMIWINEKFKTFLPDLRLKRNMNADLNGLKTYIHNNTKNTLKYFDKEKYQWDFAVVRQGFYDYSEKIYDPKKLYKNRQYMFFVIKNEIMRKYIEEIDFVQLSKNNTSTPGFSKSDVIDKIIELYQNDKFK